jgi:hypothetical protein
MCISEDAFIRTSSELRAVDSLFGSVYVHDAVTGLYVSECSPDIMVNVHAVVYGSIWGNNLLQSSIFTSTPIMRSNKYIGSEFEPCHTRDAFFSSTVLYVKFEHDVYVDGHDPIYSVIRKIAPFDAQGNSVYYHCQFNELVLHASVLFLYKHGGIIELGYSRFPVHIHTIGDPVLWVVFTMFNSDAPSCYGTFWGVTNTGQPLFVREKSRIVGYALGTGVAIVHVYMTQVVCARAMEDLLLLPHSNINFSTILPVRMRKDDGDYHGIIIPFHYIVWHLLRNLMRSIMLYEDEAHTDEDHVTVTADHPLLVVYVRRFNDCIWVVVRLICWLCPTVPGIVNASILRCAFYAPHVKRALHGLTRIDILFVLGRGKLQGFNEALVKDGFPFCVYRTEEGDDIAIFTQDNDKRFCHGNKRVFGSSNPPSLLSVSGIRVVRVCSDGAAHYDKYMNLRIKGSPRAGDIFSFRPRGRDLPDGRNELYDALKNFKDRLPFIDCQALLENLDNPVTHSVPPICSPCYQVSPPTPLKYFENVRSRAFEVFVTSRKHTSSGI